MNQIVVMNDKLSQKERFLKDSSSVTSKCPNCSGNKGHFPRLTIVSNTRNLPDYICEVACLTCSTHWFVCVSCQNMRKHMTTAK